jgi:Tol biopolymer transport system component
MELAGERDVAIVWSSNREGNHEIFFLALPDFRLVRLTDHPHVDYFPRFCPDGTKVVFARSQKPNVSQRNKIPWNVYVLDLVTGEERRVARNGNVPTWSPDGRRVFFQRNSSQVVEHVLATGRERVLFESGQGAIPDGVGLALPDFNTKEQKLAVTLRGARRMTAIYGPCEEAFERVGGGCTLSWAPCYSYLYLVVARGGRQRNAFYTYDRQTGESTKWFDLPGEFSHEYFPRMSDDGRYLVFGASTGGHEHDIADYEIFLWEIGTAWEEAARVTFNSGNDCWPDVHVVRKGGRGRG